MTLLRRSTKVGKTYQNPVPTQVGGFSTMWKVLPEFLFNRQEAEPKTPLGPFTTDASVYEKNPASGLRVTWFGHSSSLVEIDGVRVLIDPVWEQRASPFSFMGPKRFYAPTLALEAMPKLDVVLISHDHYDHLGAKTVKRLAQLQPQAKWVTALGVGAWLRRFGVAAAQITELDWTESVEIGALKLTMWPSRHFSGRGLGDRFTTLWGSYVLETSQHRLYYGADSGPWEGYAEIGAQYNGFDVVMLEIGASSPYWPTIHLGPDAAVAAYEAMGGLTGGGVMMPIHWGLFNLALHGWRQPMERMIELAAERGVKLWSPRPGEPTEVVRGDGLWSSWWQQRV
jgi:L-ascorbate metabolism protein UlaG (beta-lactamase superfamily)